MVRTDLPRDATEAEILFAEQLETELADRPEHITIKTGNYAGERGIKVVGRDGDGSLGEAVETVAQSYFGVENYACGYSEAPRVTRTTIVPPGDPKV